MTHPGNPHLATLAVGILLAASALVVLPAPEASADVVFVPVVFVQNNTLSMDLTVLGGYVQANVTREFVLNETRIMDELFDTGIVAPGSISLSARPEEPGYALLNASREGFNITFNSTASGKAQVLVRFSYSVQFESVGAINFTIKPSAKDEIRPMWEILIMSVSDLVLQVHSNTPVSIFNGTCYSNGTDVSVSEWTYLAHHPFGDRWHEAPYVVSWTGGPAAGVNETLFSRLVPEHQPMMEDLIQSESVNITIGQGTDMMPYRLDGRFNLNGSLLRQYSTVWLWFPNNITCATAKMSGEPCTIEPSVRDGQRGFYIRARYDYFRNSTLVVNITGNLTHRWCDFFIVTVPVENSTVRYILSPGFQITAYGSPFERAVFQNTTESRTLEFGGRCTGRGPVHIEFEPDLSPGTWVELSAGNVNANSVLLAWNTSGNPDFEEYGIYVSELAGWTGERVGRVTVQTVTAYEVRALRSNTTYYFSVRKLLAGNRTAYSNIVEARTLACPLSALKMTVYYTGEENAVPVLRWERCENPDFTGYELFQSDQPGYLGKSVFRTTDRSVLERVTVGLARNAAYYFTLRVSTGTNGRADSSQVQVIVPPAVPKHFQLTAYRTSDDPGTAHLHWIASNASDFGCYEVYMSTEAGPLGKRVALITERSLNDYATGGLLESQDYYFTVRAVTARNGHIDSDQVEAEVLIVDSFVPDETVEMEGPWAAIGMGAIALAALVTTAALVRAGKRRK